MFCYVLMMFVYGGYCCFLVFRFWLMRLLLVVVSVRLVFGFVVLVGSVQCCWVVEFGCCVLGHVVVSDSGFAVLVR